MYPNQGRALLGAYTRPSASYGTFMEDLYYTNDFREACSYITDHVVQLYATAKLSIPWYRGETDVRPEKPLSVLNDPLLNDDDPERTSQKRMIHHANMTARYVNGNVPYEIAATMCRAVKAYFELNRSVKDSIELKNAEYAFEVYKSQWNRQHPEQMLPDAFHATLLNTASQFLHAMKELSNFFLKYEETLNSSQMTFEFTTPDTIALESNINKVNLLLKSRCNEIMKAINDRTIEGIGITGPETDDCRKQVYAVVAYLANPKNNRSIHNACRMSFRKLPEGYSDFKKLYHWCNRNKSKIQSWVEEFRLGRRRAV